jgi:aminoglycoside 6'-N-acetyltransferase
MDETLASERLLLRPVRPDDLEPLTRILAEPEVAAWWPRYDEARVRADILGGPDAEPGRVIEAGGAVAGWVQWYEETEPDYRHVALDIFLGGAWQGSGYGPEALLLVMRAFAADGHHRFTIDPTVENERAVRAYVKAGFKPVGVMREHERAPDGRWRDSLLMDLLARELSEPGSARCARS